ncbi:MAG: hypothetical protein ABH883_05085, partial [Candidatus Omnitrophota bacterium]
DAERSNNKASVLSEQYGMKEILPDTVVKSVSGVIGNLYVTAYLRAAETEIYTGAMSDDLEVMEKHSARAALYMKSAEEKNNALEFVLRADPRQFRHILLSAEIEAYFHLAESYIVESFRLLNGMDPADHGARQKEMAELCVEKAISKARNTARGFAGWHYRAVTLRENTEEEAMFLSLKKSGAVMKAEGRSIINSGFDRERFDESCRTALNLAESAVHIARKLKTEVVIERTEQYILNLRKYMAYMYAWQFFITRAGNEDSALNGIYRNHLVKMSKTSVPAREALDLVEKMDRKTDTVKRVLSEHKVLSMLAYVSRFLGIGSVFSTGLMIYCVYCVMTGIRNLYCAICAIVPVMASLLNLGVMMFFRWKLGKYRGINADHMRILRALHGQEHEKYNNAAQDLIRVCHNCHNAYMNILQIASSVSGMERTGASGLSVQRAKIAPGAYGVTLPDTLDKALSGEPGDSETGKGIPKENMNTDFEILIGIPEKLYRKMGQTGIEELEKRFSGLKIAEVPDKSGESKMGRMVELRKKMPGGQSMAALLDIGEGSSDDMETIIGDFVNKAKKDIISLMNPEITSLTEETIKRIRDIDKLKGIAGVLVRLFDDMESLELSEKSLYEIRMNKLNSKIVLSSVQRTVDAAEYASMVSEGKQRYISISAKDSAELQVIADTLGAMYPGKDDKPASAFLQVRVFIPEKDPVKRQARLDKYMSLTGLDKYLEKKNVIAVDTLSMTLEETLEAVRDNTFEEACDARIAVGDTGMINLTEDDKQKLMAAHGPLFVQMMDENGGESGIVSQLLYAMLEISVNREKIPPSLGRAQKPDAEKYSNWYIYIPNITEADYKMMRAEMEMYREVLRNA